MLIQIELTALESRCLLAGIEILKTVAKENNELKEFKLWQELEKKLLEKLGSQFQKIENSP